MNTKSNSRAKEDQSREHLATFERLPEKTKELMKLKDQNEKATGHEHIVINKQIEAKARKPRS